MWKLVKRIFGFGDRAVIRGEAYSAAADQAEDKLPWVKAALDWVIKWGGYLLALASGFVVAVVAYVEGVIASWKTLGVVSVTLAVALALAVVFALVAWGVDQLRGRHRRLAAPDGSDPAASVTGRGSPGRRRLRLFFPAGEGHATTIARDNIARYFTLYHAFHYMEHGSSEMNNQTMTILFLLFDVEIGVRELEISADSIPLPRWELKDCSRRHAIIHFDGYLRGGVLSIEVKHGS